METKLILEDILLAVVPSNHVLAEKSYVTLKDFSTEPFLLLEDGIGIVIKDKNTIPIASKTFIHFLLSNIDMLP